MSPLFLQALLDALTLGALYALIALGYTMVYGVLAFVVQRLAYAPLRRAPRLNVLITAIGISLLLQNVGQLPWVFGTDPQPMPRLISNPVLFEIKGVQVSLLATLTIAGALALMALLEVLIFHTKFGRAMRAVSMNEKVASLMGINVNRVIDGTFMLGGALAGAAGVLFAMQYSLINQPAGETWVILGLKAFIAAVVGGIGNVRGAMVGGFLIAFLERFGASLQQFFPDTITFDTNVYRDVYCFAVLIIILLIRPSGIFGKSAVEKV